MSRTAPHPRWALAALSLSMLLSSLGTSVANVALPTLEGTFGASFGQVQWVVLGYLVAVTTLVVGAGRLGDILGRRRLLAAGIALFTAASALCAAAPGLWVLVAARALQGAGAAAMMALTIAFVSDAVPPERAGRAMGLLGSTSAVGTALGPSLGGALIAGPGWRAVFVLNVPLGLVALGLARRHLPADRGRGEGARAPFDVAGTLLLAVALGAYALALTVRGGVALLVVAAGATALFLVAERRAVAPLVGAAMLRAPGLRAGLATSGLVSTVMMATLVVGPFHLTRALGLGPAAVGLVMSAGPAAVALSGVPAGRIADRLGPRRVGVAGLCAMGGGALLLALAPTSLGVPGYLGPILVLTLGYALFQTANNTAVMAAARPDRRGVTSGMLNLSRNLGLVTGASLMGAVFAASGMRATFTLAAVLIAGAVAATAPSPIARRTAPRPR